MSTLSPDDLASLDDRAKRPSRPPGLVNKKKPEALKYEFPAPEARKPGYTIPSPQSLKGLSRVQLRDLVRRSGLVSPSVCSFLTRLEMKKLLAEEFPIEFGANYHVEARTVHNVAELVILAGDRRQAHNDRHSPHRVIRAQDKTTLLGEAALTLDAREIIERTVAGRIFELVSPEPVVLQDRLTERFYDLDGRAGRGSYYHFRDVASGADLPVSPALWYSFVRPDPTLSVHFRGVELMKPPKTYPARYGGPRPRKAVRVGSIELNFADPEMDA